MRDLWEQRKSQRELLDDEPETIKFYSILKSYSGAEMYYMNHRILKALGLESHYKSAPVDTGH